MNITVSTCCAVGIATRYGLDGPGIESRCGARFFAPVQTGPGTYSASCTMGTGSFPGVKRPGRGADHPSPPKRRGHERVELYLYSPSGPSWPVIGRTVPLPFFTCCVSAQRISLLTTGVPFSCSRSQFACFYCTSTPPRNNLVNVHC